MDKETIYLAALFHDIGKLIERSKLYENRKVTPKYAQIRHSHAKYTAFFLETYLKNFNWLNKNSQELEEFIELAAYHHNPKSDWGKIIQLADWLASAERNRDETNKSFYNTVQLKSIFGTANGEAINRFYPLSELSFNSIFATEKDEDITRKAYVGLTNKLTSSIKRIQNKEELLFFYEKYLSFVPAQTTKNEPDISLYDHSKITAAVAVCLYHQFNNGELDTKTINSYLKSTNFENIKDEHFLFIKADLSGIQNFIYNISSKGAAKSLKGRSVYLILLMEAIAKYIIKELDLEEANIIYNGGGNFYILAPHSKKNKILEVKKTIQEILYKEHNTDLICNISFLPLKMDDFGPYGSIWKDVSSLISEEKQKPLHEILHKEYDNLFKPKELIYNDNFCSVCHSVKNVQKRVDLDDLTLCDTCYSFKLLTEEIAKADYVNFENKPKYSIKYKEILNLFQYNINFNKNGSDSSYYLINNFGNEQTLKWKLGAFNLPVNKTTDNIKTFEELSEKGKLAYLKLDVDNLAKLFINGLKNPTLSRMSVLSRMLKLFFEGYLPHMINNMKKSDLSLDFKNSDEKIKDYIYITYSGGDDTLLIGNLEILLYFSKRLREEFKRFVSYNKTITFSAGLGIFNPSFPIIKAIELTEEYLTISKEILYTDEKYPTKNKITILGETFTWSEFNYILDLYKELKSLLDNKKLTKSHLQKIIYSTKNWKPILEESQSGSINAQKVWRLRYFLRTLDKSYRKKIIDIYEDMWFKNFYKKEENKIKNHQIITVAAKLADLNTRNYKGGKNV